MTKYFGYKTDIGQTPAEIFSEIPLDFNYSDAEAGSETFMTLKSLTTTYENSQPITPAQHAPLIVTIEKKLIPDSQLKIDYMVQRGPGPNPNEFWEDAFV